MFFFVGVWYTFLFLLSYKPQRGAMFSVDILQFSLVQLLCMLCVVCVNVDCIAYVVGDLDQYVSFWSNLYIFELALVSPCIIIVYNLRRKECMNICMLISSYGG